MNETEKARAAELAQRHTDKMTHAGVLAMVVADSLADGDVEGARAALPAYQEAVAAVKSVGVEMVELAGLAAEDK